METRDFGKRFVLWGTLARKKKQKMVFRQPTWEYDPPYRYSNALVIRLWRWGLMLGKWETSPASGVAEHLAQAVGAKRTSLNKHVEPASGPDYNYWS